MQTRVLIVDRNPGFGNLLRAMSSGLEITFLQSGAGVATALAGPRPSVAMVDLEAEFAETALAVLREERIPVVLVSEEESNGSDELNALIERFGVSRFLERPFPILDLPDVLRHAAAEPAPRPTSMGPVAPWARDPVAWNDITEPVVSEPVSEPVSDGPVAPWERDPDSWRGTDMAPERAPQKAPVTRYGQGAPRAEPRVQTHSESLIPPWERKPGAWTELEKPVAPWDDNPSDWNEEPERAFHSDLERVNTKTLRRLTAIWVRKRTGILTCDELRGSAAFAQGAPKDKSAETYVLDMLQQPTARMQFQDQGREPNHTREAFGALLFRAALDLAAKDWVELNASKALQPVANLDALRELPCGVAVIRVLESADGVLNLVDQLSALEVKLDEVDQYLAALDKLGVLEVLDVSVDIDRRRSRKNWVVSRGYEGPDRRRNDRRAGPERRRNRDRRRDRRSATAVTESGQDRRADDRRQSDRRTGEDRRKAPPLTATRKRRKKKKSKGSSNGPAMPSPQDMLRVLQREWKLLEHADAWTVLGLPSTEGREAVVATAQRMLARYEPVIGDARFDEETQQLAQNVSQRVRWAMSNARPVAKNHPVSATRDELIFDQGMKSLLVKDYETATKCFRTAHKMAVEDARYMGYYGWALWKRADGLSGREQSKKREEAEELLRLSDSLDNRDVSIQIFLATVELELGQLTRAKARTERLRSAGEESGQLDLLWIAIQKAQAKAETDSGPERT